MLNPLNKTLILDLHQKFFTGQLPSEPLPHASAYNFSGEAVLEGLLLLDVRPVDVIARFGLAAYDRFQELDQQLAALVLQLLHWYQFEENVKTEFATILFLRADLSEVGFRTVRTGRKSDGSSEPFGEWQTGEYHPLVNHLVAAVSAYRCPESAREALSGVHENPIE